MLSQTPSHRVPHSCGVPHAGTRLSGINACIILAAALALTSAAYAQLPAPPATTEDALRQMLDQAGAVFTGQVTAIRRIGSTNGSTGTLEIDFAVDDAIRGAAPNSIYTLREWAGISPAAASNFIVPQFEIARRYLIFLHAPGPSGLTSPVGGPDGAIPILPTAEAASPTTPDALGLAAQTALAQSAPAASTVTSRSPAHTNFRNPAAPPDSSTTPPALASSSIDLRWIATHVLTPLSYAPGGTASAHPIASRANAVLPSSQTAASTDQQSPTQSATYSDLLTLLRSWEAQSRAAR